MSKLGGAVLAFVGVMMTIGALAFGLSTQELAGRADAGEPVICGSILSPIRASTSDNSDPRPILSQQDIDACSRQTAGEQAVTLTVLVTGLGLVVFGALAFAGAVRAQTDTPDGRDLEARVRQLEAATDEQAPPDQVGSTRSSPQE